MAPVYYIALGNQPGYHRRSPKLNNTENLLMKQGVRFRGALAALLTVFACFAAEAQSDAQALDRARALLAAGNAKQAFAELEPLQGKLSGMPEYDYLLGVAALDSGRIDEAIIAFERVLALVPNHAGAQMDLARAYYAAGSFDLAESAFVKLRDASPPPAAQAAITRYLDAIRARRTQAQAGWTSFGELGLGYDSNLTGVPTNFGAAAQQSFNLIGIDATGNAIKRKAPFVQGAIGTEYTRPVGGGWSVFAGGDLRGRAYRKEHDFNTFAADVRAGGARNDGPNQWRFMGSYLEYRQEGDAPGDPKPTNDRRMAGASVDWRRALDSKTQVGLGVQYNAVRFPENKVEDFNQVFLSVSYLHTFERKGVPLLYLTGFVSDDRATNTLFDGVTTKSKNLAGTRAFLQYSLGAKTQVFGGLGVIVRRDKDSFARSTEVEKGRDVFSEASTGLLWSFREKCALRLLYAYTHNSSNIDIYDFNRHEISSNIRCEF
jgi:tetratricopeptide (TPR) repeat protein